MNMPKEHLNKDAILRGVAAPAQTVTIYKNSNVVGETVADERGHWSVKLDGEHDKNVSPFAGIKIEHGAQQIAMTRTALPSALEVKSTAKPATAKITRVVDYNNKRVFNGAYYVVPKDETKPSNEQYFTISGTGTVGEVIKLYTNGFPKRYYDNNTHTVVEFTTTVDTNGKWEIKFQPTIHGAEKYGRGAAQYQVSTIDESSNESLLSMPFLMTYRNGGDFESYIYPDTGINDSDLTTKERTLKLIVSAYGSEAFDEDVDGAFAYLESPTGELIPAFNASNWPYALTYNPDLDIWESDYITLDYSLIEQGKLTKFNKFITYITFNGVSPLDMGQPLDILPPHTAKGRILNYDTSSLTLSGTIDNAPFVGNYEDRTSLYVHIYEDDNKLGTAETSRDIERTWTFDLDAFAGRGQLKLTTIVEDRAEIARIYCYCLIIFR